MPIIVKVTEAEIQEPIPEGLYKATVIAVEESTGNFGDYLKFRFEIIDGEQKGVSRTLVASKKIKVSSTGKTSKLYGIIKALTKVEPVMDDDFDVESLKGKACQILVKNGPTKDGITYQNITDVMPL
ncbi:MAG: hypothetical protein UV61_C0001G0084 [Candidatus Gottesmanbacteria bacterium GW2011_GWB1_43_11]|uniref:DUF669 domain-containing protein n=1 Tax=Candidatus Gottesmanbacteria bacterium GW2011_GWB1_43_11 TaxID=1618446 RepID=A0A0G1CQF1_9BACT|nr:MAG: hypothetical protein UV04_C0004G0026 [Candidatus Gottesmanbacteria bacterium GW2011_GWA2_42_16]KKS56049.1 MAG: hypothetical protein UV17_C0003G0021 [Candidatus Gottesmanbacteria bacterium GW2011_GWA1_42_26]KKS81639.1 MAG: hypothetical protein UV55_C0011G0033 [Candidatus Gottesmanbacteria bacterium GW2011_GWC1_43_10]KKS87677.1 MAG: hypothetical protein UV61_C0001G0084 [Candidatus Gottesmanbacteria bacterium GW2011_GWB1_43_11]OGG07492.1 MAG: hypothetical protein A2699_00400 [Candidatus Go